MNKIYIDFEMNMPNSKHGRDINNADIIAIGAIKYDIATKQITDFKSLIKPVSNIEIYPHIEELTKITNEDIKKAPSYEDVMRKFKKWLGDISEIQGIYTFGNMDLTCFINTDRRSSEKNNHPRFANNIKDLFVDIKKEYLKSGIKCINYISLKNLLYYSNIEFDGDVHDPLADSYNLLKLDMILSSQEYIRELLTIKDLIRKPFTEINMNLELSFEIYKNEVHKYGYDTNLDDISIEVLNTLKLYLKSIENIDIYNIEQIKDVNRKISTFKNLIEIKSGYFYLLENVYLDITELMEDVSYYRLSKEQFKQELNQILELFYKDLEDANLGCELQASY